MDSSRSLEIIIARYKEDIEWKNQITIPCQKSIYNKFYFEGIKLENTGREGHTYLHHIYHRYHNLSDFNLFSQGDPIFHDSEFIAKINNLNINNLSLEHPIFFGISGKEGIYGNYDSRHPNGLPLYYFLDFLFNKKVSLNDIFTIPYGGIFLVSKEIIRYRPKEFYGFLLKLLSNEVDPIEGYILERLWPFIFDVKLPISDKYKKFITQC